VPIHSETDFRLQEEAIEEWEGGSPYQDCVDKISDFY
jgi:hypothetical protein